MKRRNREMNPFGMASLDLFASALGAFILISVVIFPYIADVPQSAPSATPPPPQMAVATAPDEPAACPVCPTPTLVPALLSCPVCPTLPPTEPAEECPVQPPPVCPACPTPEPAPDPPACPVAAPSGHQFPNLDLVIVLDVTSSMGRQVAGLKAEVGQLSELMGQLAPSFGIGMVAFGDRNWERPLAVFPLRQITGPTVNRAAFRGFVNGLDTQMGLGGGMNLDPQEAFLVALAEAARMPWRPQAEHRVIVMITDNAAYPEEANQAIVTAAAIGRQPRHRVSTVYINTTGAPSPQAEDFLQRVATAGGGQYVRDVGGSLTVNLLLSLL